MHEITLVTPVPAGEGGGGDRGQKSKLKAGQAGDKKGKPPAAFAIPAPGERTISNAEVPLPRSPLSLAAGTANRKAVLSFFRLTSGSPCTGYLLGRLCKCRLRLSPGDARGEAPCIK